MIMHWEVDAVFDIISISESFNYEVVRLTEQKAKACDIFLQVAT